MADQDKKTQQPSLIGGHAQYVKGQAEAGVAALTGSQAWNESASQDKSRGIDTMKAASANRNPKESGFGKVEEKLGAAVGCEGMEQEGAQSKTRTRTKEEENDIKRMGAEI